MYQRVTPKHEPNYIRECVSYDGATGTFTWLVRPLSHFKTEAAGKRWNAVFSGASCGSVVEGRKVICINGIKYPATHIAWAVIFGRWPNRYLDHINGDVLDNRLVNLRDVSDAENAKNCRRRKDNSSGVTGVYADKWGNWEAQIGVNGRRICLGYFRDFDTALKARRIAERKYGFHQNHGRAA